MSFLSGIGDLLKQYTGSNPSSTNVEQHFDQVSQAVPTSSVASGVAEALRSGQAGSFSQVAAQLFSKGNGTQQASILSGLLASAGPAVLSQFTAKNPNSPLASLLSAGQSAITPAQASSVSSADVAALAQHAHDQDPSIVDRVSQIYAQHPTLVKTLGAAALTVAVKKIAEQHAA